MRTAEELNEHEQRFRNLLRRRGRTRTPTDGKLCRFVVPLIVRRSQRRRHVSGVGFESGPQRNGP